MHMRVQKKLYFTIYITFISFYSSLYAQGLSSKRDNLDKKEGYIQKSLDNWLEKKWTPATKSEDNLTKNRFKLQDYVDKAVLYMKAEPSDEHNSNVRKLDKMPVIGKPKD